MVGSDDVEEGGPGLGREWLRIGYCVICWYVSLLCLRRWDLRSWVAGFCLRMRCCASVWDDVNVACLGVTSVVRDASWYCNAEILGSYCDALVILAFATNGVHILSARSCGSNRLSGRSESIWSSRT